MDACFFDVLHEEMLALVGDPLPSLDTSVVLNSLFRCLLTAGNPGIPPQPSENASLVFGIVSL